MTNKKAFIFDLDGVIVDTARYHFLAWQKIASDLGIEFTPEHNEALKGVSRIRSLDIILKLGNIEASEENKNKWLTQKNDDYLSYIENMDETEILPGVLNILEFIKEKNHFVAFSNLAALRKTSGSGFAFVTSFPSTMASNKCKIFTFSKIGRAFLLAEPNAIK